MELDKCPLKLKEKALEYLKTHEDSKILGVYISEGIKPYIDKSITQNLYIVSLEWGNLCISMSFRTCSKPEWNFNEVSINSMIYAEILNIVNNCDFLKHQIKS